MHRFTRSGTSRDFPAVKLPPRRDIGARALEDVVESAKKVSKGSRRMLMQGAQSTRLEDSWSTVPETADSIIYHNLRPLVARSRREYLSNDYAKRFCSMLRKNVPGPKGITFISDVRDADGKIDQLAKDAIEAAWAEQSTAENWEVTGQMDRASFERLWITTCALDGEALAIIVTGKDVGPTGFALQMIDTMRLDPQHNEELGGGRFIRAGIEYNQLGRAIAYHITEIPPNTPLHAGVYYTRKTQRIDAGRVIHAYIAELTGQRRGLPWMHTAIWRLHNLKGFEDAAVINARAGAAKQGFVRNKDADDGDDEDIEIDSEPGSFQNIGSYEFVDYSPQFPETSTESFMKTQLRGVASGLDVSYNTLASDLSGVNFSSLRDGKLDERETYKVLQEWMISTFCRRVFKVWIERSILAGSIKVKGNPLRLDRLDKYSKAIFRGRRWTWVDPKSEVEAAKTAVEARFASRSQYISDWNEGGDPYDTFEAIAEEEKTMKNLGVQILTTPGAGMIGGHKPSPPEE
jgi:lambda family phage portal protein